MSEGRGRWLLGALMLLFVFINSAGLTWGSERERISQFAEATDTHTDTHDVQSTQSDLDSFIKKQLNKAHIPGLSSVIIKDGKIVWTGVYGWARIGNKPVTSDTVFYLASVSKAVVAVAVMKAWEEGDFNLDEDINTYLPFSVRNPHAPDKPITVRMLLTHTSSIRDRGDVLDSSYAQNRDSLIGLEKFLIGYLTLDGYNYDSTSFYDEDPGTDYHYSNIATTLAAYLVEVTSGMPFDIYCNLKIFQPLGMKETSWLLAGLDRSHIAMPYGYDAFLHFYYPYGLFSYPDYPDGLLKTSAPQLARLLNMFMQYGELDGVRILRKETVEEMRRVQNPAINPNQGLIWHYKDLSGWTLFGKDGRDIGVTTEMFFRPEDGIGVIILMNGDCTPIDTRTVMEIETRIFKEAELN